ncbi:MAG: hypothetical protein ACI32N_09620 [Bulleidia sp.]
MREKKSFAQRTETRKTDEARKKYFLVFEGDKTEELYFEEVSANRNKLGIDPLIELVPVVRSFSETGWSNPKKIVDRILDNLKESRTGYISYETLLNRIMDLLENEGTLTNGTKKAKIFWDTLRSICEEELHVKLIDSVSDLEKTYQMIAESFSRDAINGTLVDTVPQIIRNRGICL